jgi:hypothetical protein
MSLAPEPGLRLQDHGSHGQHRDHARPLGDRLSPKAVAPRTMRDPEIRLRRLLLRAIDAYDSQNGAGPTVFELADDLGIPPDFGHHDLVGRLQRELSLGYVSHYRSRFTLTPTGRNLIVSEARAPHDA